MKPAAGLLVALALAAGLLTLLHAEAAGDAGGPAPDERRCPVLAVLTNALTDLARGAPELGKRSPDWPALRKRWLRESGACAACGTRSALEVHHVRPVHVAPALELRWDNLLTLCKRCHLFVGHLSEWRSWNPNAVADAAWWRSKVLGRPYLDDPTYH